MNLRDNPLILELLLWPSSLHLKVSSWLQATFSQFLQRTDFSYFFHYCFISESSNILLLLIQGHFRRSPRKSISFVDEQAVEIPTIPIILEITACAILLPAQFPLGGWWAVVGCSLLSRARARARTWSEEHAGGVGCGGWREVSCCERSQD